MRMQRLGPRRLSRVSPPPQENVVPVEIPQADLTASQLLPLEQWDFDWDGSEAAAVLPKG